MLTFCFDSWETFRLVLFVLRPALGIVQSSSNSHDDKHSPLTGESVMVVIPLPGWPDYKSFHSRWATWSFPLLYLKEYGFWLRCTLKFLFAPLNQIATWITFSCFFEPMRIHWLKSLESILIPSGWNSFSRMRVPITVPLVLGERGWDGDWITSPIVSEHFLGKEEELICANITFQSEMCYSTQISQNINIEHYTTIISLFGQI